MAITRDDVVRWWEFQNILTDYAAGEDATNTNATSDTSAPSSKFIGSYDYNGSSARMDLGISNIETTGSISCWAKATTGDEYIISCRDDTGNGDFFLRFRSTGEIQFRIYDGSTITVEGGSYTSDEWTHIVVTWDAGGGLGLYVNGSSADTGSIGSYDGSASANLHIGYDTRLNSYGNVTVGQVAYFNKVLSGTEITDLYNSGDGKTWLDYFPLEEDLELYYTLDSDYTDSTDNSIDGTATGTPAAIDGRLNGGRQFVSGSSEAIEFDSASLAFTHTDNFTLAFWVKTTDSGGFILGNSDDSDYGAGYIFINCDGDFSGEVEGGSSGWSANLGTHINDGSWHHMVCVHDGTGGDVYVYVDGSQDATDNITESGTYSDAGQWAIATLRNRENGSDYINMDFDEFAIFTRALTAGEAKRLYNYGMGKMYSELSNTSPLLEGLADYYSFDSDATSSRGFTPDGTVTGASNVTGKINNDYDYDGSGDYISISDSTTGLLTDTASEISIQIWATFDDTSTNRQFAYHQRNGDGEISIGWRLDNATTELMSRTFNGSSFDYTRSGVTSPSGYQHIVYTTDATNISLWTNNNEVTDTTTLAAPAPQSCVWVGAFKSGGSPILEHDGNVDELAFWNRRLTAADVAALYASGDGVQYPFADEEAPAASPESRGTWID